MNDMDSTPQRPTFLTVLCIIGFVWAGLAILGGTFSYIGMKMMASGAIEEMIEASGDANAIEQFEQAQAKLDEAGLDAGTMALNSMITVVLAIVALVGVIMMWKLKRTGFFIFSAAQIVGVLSPVLFGGNMDFSVSGVVFHLLTLLLIGLFAMNLKHMR